MSAVRMISPQPSIISRLVALAKDQELDPVARRALASIFFDDTIAPEAVDVSYFVPLLYAALDCRRGCGSVAEVERIAARALCLDTRVALVECRR